MLLLWQVGRESPADIIVAVPTVSTRHAMLRLGAGPSIVSSCFLNFASWTPCLNTLQLSCICYKLSAEPSKPQQMCNAPAENNRVSVTDLSSTNGTYLDDEELVPLRAIEMSVGTEITFGNKLVYWQAARYIQRQSCAECWLLYRGHVSSEVQAGGEGVSSHCIGFCL